MRLYIVTLLPTSSGLGGVLFTTGEGAGLPGDAALSALERSLFEPRLLLLATAHMCRKRCCSSCSQWACLAANASSLRSCVIIRLGYYSNIAYIPQNEHQSHLTESRPLQGSPSILVLGSLCILIFPGEQKRRWSKVLQNC